MLLFVFVVIVCLGVLWDTKVNRSSHAGTAGGSIDELIVVGAFDTVSKTSQVSLPNTTKSPVMISSNDKRNCPYLNIL